MAFQNEKAGVVKHHRDRHRLAMTNAVTVATLNFGVARTVINT